MEALSKASQAGAALRRPLVSIGLVLTLALLVILGADAGAKVWLGERAEPTLKRPPNVVDLPQKVAALPNPKPGAQFLLIGNSHTYALPGRHAGEPLRPDFGGTLLDELAARLSPPDQQSGPTFYRLAHPNLLPFEALSRVTQMLLRGYRPGVVVWGITFRNLARDSALRDDIHALYKDEGFYRGLSEVLSESGVAAPPAVSAAVRAERRRALFEVESELEVSDADRWDEHLTKQLSTRLTLLGRSAELRARLLRRAAQGLGARVGERRDVAFSYDVLEADLALNLAMTRTLAHLLRSRGAHVIAYFAPERSDATPLVDPARRARVVPELSLELEALGITVLDARDVVPNEFWGWDGDNPDRSHFTEPGHRLLATFIVQSGERTHSWAPLGLAPR